MEVARREVLFALLAAVALEACGARTGLRDDERRRSEDERDASLGRVDAGADVFDARPDIFDARPDVVDARPDIVEPPRDVAIIDCREAGITYVYLISSESRLMRFYPPSGSFDTIGNIACPAQGAATPFSMAVDREGIAYVLYNDGELFRVSTLTASCQPTGFVVGQNGFPARFGMGFSSNQGDLGESLFVVSSGTGGGNFPTTLATIDPSTFELQIIAPFSTMIGNPELTGTGDSRLFAFAPPGNTGPGGGRISHLAEIDKSNASVMNDVRLELGQGNISAWAFAFWGGDFYIFTTETRGSSRVHRYTPLGPTTPPIVGQVNATIVGAGVSTCAPAT